MTASIVCMHAYVKLDLLLDLLRSVTTTSDTDNMDL